MNAQNTIVLSAAGIVILVFGLTGLLFAQQVKTEWDGVYTVSQAGRGEALYSKYCANCHGPNLTGGEMAPALAGGEFRANWNDLSLGELFDRMRTSMPQDNPGSLSRSQNADILAYMLQKNNFPAGDVELATESEQLNSIKFVSQKAEPR